MEETAYQSVRLMRREDLEEFAVRAALELRRRRQENEAGPDFFTVLAGFLLGAVVSASGLILGLGLA